MTSMYDSTQPWLIPAAAEYIAIYANGQYAASRENVQDKFPQARIFSIDVLGTDPGAGIADVESGNMRPADVPGWVDRRLTAHPNGVLCRVYCNRSTWPAVKAEVAKLSPDKRATIRYWIADPTGSAHSIPGADATQYYWGSDWDESTIDTSRFAGG